jgi:hypothetical protein
MSTKLMFSPSGRDLFEDMAEMTCLLPTTLSGGGTHPAATDLVDAYSAYALSAYANGKADPTAVVAATAAMRQACG